LIIYPEISQIFATLGLTYTVNKTSGLTLVVVTFLNSDTKRDHLLVFFDDRGVVSAIGKSLDADRTSYKLPFGQ